MTFEHDTKDTLCGGAWNDQHTEDYVQQWGELALHQQIPELCNILPSETVLDIGCGSGAAVRAIAASLTTGHVTGIDPTPKMLEIASGIAANNDQRMTFLLAGAEQIPLESDSCDLVIAVNTLHHWVHVDVGLDEVLRVLKPSGRFVAIDDLWEEAVEYSEEGLGDDKDKDKDKDHELKTRDGIVTLLNGKGFLNISNCVHREPDATASIITGYKL